MTVWEFIWLQTKADLLMDLLLFPLGLAVFLFLTRKR